MSHESDSPGFDPYRPLGPNLKRGDRLNRWVLVRPRRRIVRLLKGQRVLGVCCGTGNLTAMLVAAGCQAVGVDSSFTMLSHARLKHIPAEWIQMDAARLPFQHELDAAVISLALHEMPSPVRGKVWESMRRAVRPGGLLVALDFVVPLHPGLLARVAGGWPSRLGPGAGAAAGGGVPFLGRGRGGGGLRSMKPVSGVPLVLYLVAILTALTDTASGAAVTFACDADGRRVRRTDAGGSTYYAGAFELRVPATTLNGTVGVIQPLNQFPWPGTPRQMLGRRLAEG